MRAGSRITAARAESSTSDALGDYTTRLSGRIKTRETTDASAVTRVRALRDGDQYARCGDGGDRSHTRLLLDPGRRDELNVPSMDGSRGSSCLRRTALLSEAKLCKDLLVVLPDLGNGEHDRLRSVQGGRREEPAQRTHGRAELAPAVSSLQLGVIEELPNGAHPGVRYPRRFEFLYNLLRGEAGEDAFYIGVQRVTVLHSP